MILGQRIIYILAFGLVGMLCSAAPAPTILPCGVRVAHDSHTGYDINTTEVERLLEENAFPCPYILDMTIWSQVDLDRVLLRDGRAFLGIYTNDTFPTTRTIPIHHIISVYLPDDELVIIETPGHDYSTATILLGTERGTWVILHELGHMILWEKGSQYAGSEAELWCDHFANEHYDHYSLIEGE